MRKNGQLSITAKDIGRHLGLSQSTVSRILSDAPGHRVSPETRQRVLETATRLGYRPNAIARSLRQRRTNIVGFYTGYGTLDSRNAFLAEIIGGLMRAADTHRQDLLLHGVFRGTSTDDIFNELMDGRIDGLFVHTHAEDPLVTRLRACSLPVVALADPIPGIPSVVCDDRRGMRVLLDFLFERGHRRIGFIRPRFRLTSVEIRCEAFIDVMVERGAKPDEMPVFEIEVESAAPALEAIQKREQPLTAVCCWNDLTAMDLIYCCQQQGIRVPEELAVVGFDGLLDPRRSLRPLVTIGANWGRAADVAMEAMMRQIAQGAPGSVPADAGDYEAISMLTCMPVELLKGDTA